MDTEPCSVALRCSRCLGRGSGRGEGARATPLPGLGPLDSLQKATQVRWLRWLHRGLQETQVFSRGSQNCSSGQGLMAAPVHRPCG